MAKKKCKRRNTPRRKRFNRRQRLDSAKNWVSTYEGGNIAKAYRKYYGIDWVATFIELEMLGIEIDPKYKDSVIESVHGQAEARKKKRLLKSKGDEYELEDYQDENFAYIVGYTSWGFPYGVTWEEWEELESLETIEEENDNMFKWKKPANPA